MSNMEWHFVDAQAEERLARIEYYSVVKQQDGQEIEFIIAVREYLHPKDPSVKFLATADKQTNQKTMAFTPTGWGTTMLRALSECVQAIRRFPYEPA